MAAINSASPFYLFWFRRDLRLEDNRGFSEALQAARAEKVPLVASFIFDKNILERLEDRDDARVAFLHKTLSEMKAHLCGLGSDLVVLHGRPEEIFKDILHHGLSVDTESGASRKFLGIPAKIFANHDYEPYALSRDRNIAELVTAKSSSFATFKDQVIFEKGEVLKDNGAPYTVFTPFARKWRAVLEQRLANGVDELRPQSCGKHFSALMKFGFDCRMPTLEEIGFRQNSIVQVPGVKLASAILVDYALNRNTPAVRGTSRLGIHLRFGTVSVRRLVKTAFDLGAEAWLTELIWREFFMQILFHFPHVHHSAFREDYNKIAWRNAPKEFDKWCLGQTGFPIVDAGMRELNETGFMHNRVRMIAASFLVKHLLIDWRMGERYFARKLLDFELASNNGNWQWVAGSGCDAAPYFRVFNPELQTKKFDPDLRYIKTWVPEFGTEKYPEPMVEHVFARERTLRAYRVIRKK